MSEWHVRPSGLRVQRAVEDRRVLMSFVACTVKIFAREPGRFKCMKDTWQLALRACKTPHAQLLCQHSAIENPRCHCWAQGPLDCLEGICCAGA